MALNIKNAETERLARELARRRGQSVTKVLTEVLRREMNNERKKPRDLDSLLRDLDAITERLNRHPVLDERSADEIMEYNDQGHFD